MTAGDSNSARIVGREDRELMKRLTIVLAFIFVFTAAFSRLVAVYEQKFHDRTASARWIFARHDISSNEPIAFFAARDITLPPNRVYTRLKLLGDPEYTLYINGKEVAGRRVGEERALDYYDISELVQTGRNRIVVAVRAPKGVGGILASIDIAPETENWVVSDGQWKIYRQWDPLLLEFDIAGRAEAPMLIGEPPIGRWNYLDIARRDAGLAPLQVLTAKDSFEVRDARLPVIRTERGVSVATTEAARATAYDFGFTEGRARVTIERERAFSRLVYVRFANHRDELPLVEWNLRPIVFAPGEREVSTPEAHAFRYAMAFGRDVKIDVLREPVSK